MSDSRTLTSKTKVYVSQGFLYGDGAVRNATVAEQTLGDEIERLRGALRECRKFIAPRADESWAWLDQVLDVTAHETSEAPEKCGGKCPRHGPYVLLGRTGPCPICEEIKQRASKKALEPRCGKCGQDLTGKLAHECPTVSEEV